MVWLYNGAQTCLNWDIGRHTHTCTHTHTHELYRYRFLPIIPILSGTDDSNSRYRLCGRLRHRLWEARLKADVLTKIPSKLPIYPYKFPKTFFHHMHSHAHSHTRKYWSERRCLKYYVIVELRKQQTFEQSLMSNSANDDLTDCQLFTADKTLKKSFLSSHCISVSFLNLSK